MSNPSLVWITVRHDYKIAAIPVTKEFLDDEQQWVRGVLPDESGVTA